MSSTGEAGTQTRSGSPSTSEESQQQARPSDEETQRLQTGQHRGGSRPAPAQARGGRRVRLTVSRVDPWSVFKISFLLSIALGIAGVVMVAVLWSVLAGMGAFEQVNRFIHSIVGSQTNPFDLLDYIGFGRVVSLSVVVGVVDVVLITAMSTLSAFLYNICSALVGGIRMTLTDD